jgi:hypothetical protein
LAHLLILEQVHPSHLLHPQQLALALLQSFSTFSLKLSFWMLLLFSLISWLIIFSLMILHFFYTELLLTPLQLLQRHRHHLSLL